VLPPDTLAGLCRLAWSFCPSEAAALNGLRNHPLELCTAAMVMDPHVFWNECSPRNGVRMASRFHELSLAEVFSIMCCNS
jgi:hypothetical protein